MKLWMVMIGLTACKTIDAGKYAPAPGSSDGSVDSGLADEGQAPIDCDAVFDFNWVNFGQGFVTQSCNGCHHSESPDRYGAPEESVFDGVGDVWAQRGIVLALAGGDSPRMPPNGGTTDLERSKLEIWLTCGEPGH
jgi:hypothetical protein